MTFALGANVFKIAQNYVFLLIEAKEVPNFQKK